MKRGPILVAAIFFLSFFSCDSYTDVSIENSTDSTVTEVVITNGFDKINLDSIPINEVVKSLLLFKEEIKGDGGYSLKFEINGTTKFKRFGYYTNGAPLGESYYIEIKNDTILVDSKFE